MTQETEQTLLTSETTGTGENPQSSQAAVTALTGKRANWTIAHKIEGTKITWNVKDAGALVLDLAAVAQANKERAMGHGFVQRVSDAAAMARDSKTGKSATPQQKFEAMKRLVEHYMSGSEEWSPARATEGVGRPRVDRDKELLAMALGIFQPQKDAGTIAQFVQGLKKEQVTALLVSEQLGESVALAREEMEKESREAAKGVDAEELLKGL